MVVLWIDGADFSTNKQEINTICPKNPQNLYRWFNQDKIYMTDKEKFDQTIADLESGKVRVAEKVNGEWKVNSWVKEVILSGFRLGQLTDMTQGQFSFFDKDTIPARKFTAENGVRIVPGGSSVRSGAYLAPSVIMMPPAYVNIGAFVDEGTMIDSHALVGSCAQVGKHVHLSAASQLGGVLEPVGALPVIIDDNVYILAEPILECD